MYIVVQSVGGIAGAGILNMLMPVKDDAKPVIYKCTPTPGTGVTISETFGYEFLITFILVMTVFASCDSLREVGGSGPLAIGLSVSMCHLWAVRIQIKQLYIDNYAGSA